MRESEVRSQEAGARSEEPEGLVFGLSTLGETLGVGGISLEKCAIEAPPAFGFIGIDLLRPSKTNPRKSFSEEKLKELAESLKGDGGMIEPLVVRPDGIALSASMSLPRVHQEMQSYEIIAGERRYRAAKIAGFTEVPCIVRELSDDQVLEIQIIENLQREDLSPIEEGAGYKILMEKSGLDAETIGKKVGKSRRYVYGRMKLCNLAPEVAKVLQDGIISASHGDLLGRLVWRDQVEILARHFQYDKDDDPELYETVSVRDLEEIIKRDYYRSLDSASFPKVDAELLPKAGARTVCAKNSAVTPDLAPGRKGPTCADAGCFAAKLDAHIRRLLEEAGKDGKVLRLSGKYMLGEKKGAIGTDKYVEAKPGSCEYACVGIVVDAYREDEIGKKLTVCAEKKCKKHHPMTSTDGAAAYRAQIKAEERKKNLERNARKQLWLKLRETVPESMGEKDWVWVAQAVIERLGNDTRGLACQVLGLKGIKVDYRSDFETPLLEYCKAAGKGIAKAVGLVALAGGLETFGKDEEVPLFKLGGEYNLSIAKFRELAAAELKDRELKKASKAKGAKTAAKTEVKPEAETAKKVQTAAPKSTGKKKVLDKKSKKR